MSSKESEILSQTLDFKSLNECTRSCYQSRSAQGRRAPRDPKIDIVNQRLITERGQKSNT